MQYTRPATWEDVKVIARELEAAGAEYALVGGYALAAHGFSRFTEDVDLLVNPSRENAQRWIVALSRLPDGAAGELAAQPDIFASDKRYAVRINDEITVDIMPSIAGFTWEQMRSHVSSVEIDGQRIRLLDLPGLLKTKQGARPKDQMDAAVLRAALERLDRS
jgi:hypothetical protein